jgi:guanine deaminase
MLAHGTTTMCSFATIHPESVDAFFTPPRARGMRALAGKTCMDRNAPDGLRDTPRSAHDDSAALIARWHGVDRLSYVITPRFAPTSSPEQLEALGALWAAHPDCLMQTHLSEQTDEIAWVRALCSAGARLSRCLRTLRPSGAGLCLRPLHPPEARERARLREVRRGAGSLPDLQHLHRLGAVRHGRAEGEGQRVGLATDIGGGSSFSMLRTMAAAYEVAQLRGAALHPAALWWLATAGSAAALGLGDRIGNLAVGMEADLAVIDLASTPAIAQRAARAETIWEALFPTIMMGDDRAVRAVWVNGAPVSPE